jgi:MFS family permease
MTAIALPSFSTRLAAGLAGRGIHYGWIIAGTTFLTMLATAGALGTAGVMIVPLQREFGWSNGDISAALAVRLILFGLMGPFAAALMNRFGVRAVVMSALLIIVAGLAASLAMREVWQLILLWGVVVGFGTGMTALVLGATVASRWFNKRRGLVLGLMSASTATGQLVFQPLVASIANSIGWRPALGITIGVLIAALALVALLMRDHPDDVALAPFGSTERVKTAATQHGLKPLLLSPVLALREAAKTNTFWVLFVTFFICGLSTNGLIQTHWITLCGDFGVAPVGAASYLAILGIFDFVGTIMSGWLSDRFDNRRLLFMYYALRGLSLIYLPFTDFNLYELSIFAVLYGLDWIATVPPTVKLAAEKFGPEKAGLTFGWIFAGHQLGAATAAFGAGATRDEFATYLPALFVAGGFCIIAALLCLTIVRPSKAEPIGRFAAKPA